MNETEKENEVKTLEQLFVQDHLEMRQELAQKKAENESLKGALSKTMRELRYLKELIKTHTDPVKVKDGKLDQCSICSYFYFYSTDEGKNKEISDYLLGFLDTFEEKDDEEKEEK